MPGTSKGSPKGIRCVSKDSCDFTKEILVPRRELSVKKETIGFPKRTFASPKGVSQIRVSVRQMMYMDQFEAFR